MAAHKRYLSFVSAATLPIFLIRVVPSLYYDSPRFLSPKRNKNYTKSNDSRDFYASIQKFSNTFRFIFAILFNANSTIAIYSVLKLKNYSSFVFLLKNRMLTTEGFIQPYDLIMSVIKAPLNDVFLSSLALFLDSLLSASNSSYTFSFLLYVYFLTCIPVVRKKNRLFNLRNYRFRDLISCLPKCLSVYLRTNYFS